MPVIDQNRRVVGMVLIIISSVGISFGGLISRNMETADAWQINFHRSLSLIVIVAAVLLFRYRGRIGGQLIAVGWPGLFGAALLTLTAAAFMQAITTTTVANTLFTLAAIPFITALLAWLFLRERFGRITLATMIVAACGIVLMLADGIGGGSPLGNAMALAAAVGFSSYAVIVRRYRRIDMLPALLLSGVMLAFIAFLLRFDDWAISWWDFGLCFLWGGLLSGIGNILFITASRYLLAAEITLFMLLEFALGPIWVWWFADETPSRWTLAGGLLIMTAVLARTAYQVRVSRRMAVRGRLAGPS